MGTVQAKAESAMQDQGLSSQKQGFLLTPTFLRPSNPLELFSSGSDHRPLKERDISLRLTASQRVQMDQRLEHKASHTETHLSESGKYT